MQRMLGRRSFVRSLGLFVGSLPVTTSIRSINAQHATKRVGFLIGDAPTLIEAFEKELARLGYVHGKNIVIEKRISSVTSDLNVHATEFAKMDLDLVLAAALPQALAMQRANPNMPMVIGTCPGMVSNGFASSIKRPGGIYTGMDELPPGVTAKRLRFLKLAAPAVKNVALLSTTPGIGGHEAQLIDAEKAARALNLRVKPYRARTLKELESALAAIENENIDGMLNFQGGLSLANRAMIVAFAEKLRLPTVYQSRFFVEAGGLMAWAPDQEKQFKIAAKYVAKILKGAKPGNLPVHYPDRYYLTINRNAAEKIGLSLPAAILARADLQLG